MCILGIFLLASVSASDLNETVVSEIDEEVMSIEDTQGEISLGASENQDDLCVNHTPQKFSDIQTSVNDANNGDTIVLDGYYLFNNTIDVGKQLTIVGINDATLDGNNSVRLFSVSNSAVTFINITFINAKTTSGNGGAVYFSYSGSFVNCRFVDNSVSGSSYSGGAIYFNGAGGSLVDCTFVGNSAFRGGAVRFNTGGSIVNCSFIRNSVTGSSYGGGAIYFTNDGASVTDCRFVNNSAKYSSGGAIYLGSLGSFKNCTFVNNTARDQGGAFRGGYRGSVVNCSFVNNYLTGSSYGGGAVYFARNGYVEDCKFISNSVKSYGGAVYFTSGYPGSCVDCTFIANSAKSCGGAMYRGSADNCSFINNTAYQGGAIGYAEAFNSIFIGNVASFEGGGIIRGYATNCTFINNSASSSGGGVFGYSAINCSFINNFANYGGGVGGGDCLAVNCSFINNSANYGGAVNDGSATNCSFIGNTAMYNGGAICKSSPNDRCTVENSSFVGNSAGGNGDSVYAGTSIDCVFDVYPEDNYHYTSFIDVNNFLVLEDNNKLLIARLYDLRGPVANKTIAFNIEGYNYNATSDNEGLAKLNVNNIFSGSGSFNVFVSFEGDDVNYPVSISAVVSVKSRSILSVNNLSIFMEDNGYLVANLSDDNGPLFGKLITVSVNNKDYNLTTDFNGLARFNIKNLLNESGSYDVQVIFKGDGIASSASAISHVVIKKYDPVLEINDLIINVDENGTLVANLYDSRGKLSNKSISFTINGKKHVMVTDKDGLAKLNISGMDAGNYDVVVNFTGDEYNNPISVISHVLIEKHDSILDVNDIFIVLGDDYVLIANLSNICGPLDGRNVTFNINDVNYVYNTDSNGLVRFDKDVFSEYGTYIVGVSFAGDEYNNPVSVNATVCINRNIYNITVEQVGNYYGETNLTFKLVDSKTNASISDTQIILTFSNGIVVNGTTNSNGEFIYEVPFAPGSYGIDLSVNLSDVGINRFGLNNFEISKIVGRINIAQDKDCRILNIKLFNPSNNEVFTNFNITLTFEPTGDEFTVKTDNKGIVSYNMDFDLGTYSVTASVSGDYVEFDSVRLDNIIINNYPNSEIHIEDSSEFNYLETGYIGVIVDGGTLKSSDIYIVGHPEAIINLTGSSLITISNLTAGTYDLKIKSTPDSEYNPVTRTMLIKVKKIDCEVSVSNFTLDYGGSGFTPFAIVGGSVGSVSVVGHPEAVIDFSDDKIFVSNLTVGNYTLSIGADPDENHNSVIRTVGIAVNKVDCVVDVDDISFEYDDLGSTNFTVVGGSIGSVNIADYPEIRPNVFGNRITVSGLDVGNYTLVIGTIPDENHNQVTCNVSISVMEKESKVEFNDIVHPYYGGYGYYYLTANYCQILKENIDVVGHPEAGIDFDGKKVTIYNLPGGNYLLNVVSTPYKNYKSVTKSTEIIVNKVNSNVFFSHDIIVFDYLQSGSTRITVDGGYVSHKNIKFVGHPEAVIDFDGEKITVSNLTAGRYTLYVTTTPDDNHNSVTTNISVIVNKIDMEVNFTNEIIFDEGSFGCSDVDIDGGSLSDVYVINHTEAVVNVSGNHISVSNLTFGNYTLCVNTIPDANHNSINGLLQITVSKVPTIIEFTNEIVFDYDGIGNTTVNVWGGSVLPYDIVVAGHSEAEITINNKNMIFVSNLTVGEYTLSVRTTPDENHRFSLGNISISVNKIQSRIICEDIIFDYDKFGFASVTVDGGSLNTADVYIVNHTDANLRISSDSVTFSDLKAGNYLLHLSTVPDKNHYAVESWTNVIVNKINSSVSAPSIVFDYLGSGLTYVQVNGGVIDSGNLIIAGNPNARIDFDNNFIHVSNLNAGQYNLTVKTIPDENHNSVIANVSITVNKIASSIKFSNNIVFDYSKSGSTTVETVGGSIGAVGVVDHPEIKPKVSGNKITVSGLDVGSYKLRVAINPDGNHKYDERFATITVKKVSGKIKASSKSVVLKKGTKWTVKLTDSKGNPISGVKIKFKVSKGKTIEVATNSKGEASYNTKKLSKGKHKVVVSVSHAGYNVKSVTSSIKVVKQTKLKFKSTSNKNKDSTTVMFRVYKGEKPVNGIKLKLLVYTGKKVVKTIKLKSKTFKKKKGIVGYTTNELSPGKHKVVLKPVDIKYTGSKKATLKLTKKQTKYPPISSKV